MSKELKIGAMHVLFGSCDGHTCGECGREWKYHTNIDARLLETTCINCNSPMVAEQDKNGNYAPIR